jgi:hypothetical protein
VTKFRKRAQHWEGGAATAIDPEKREHWQRVADAWHCAAQAAARTPPLIWQWNRKKSASYGKFLCIWFGNNRVAAASRCCTARKMSVMMSVMMSTRS